jgi:hypothetical protein
MLFRHGLLVAIVITIVVSLVPSPSAALEVHELEEYWLEEPLPETPPLGLIGGRTDAPVADSIERHHRWGAAVFSMRVDVRRLIPARRETDDAGDRLDRREAAKRPRMSPATRASEDSTDPL